MQVKENASLISFYATYLVPFYSVSAGKNLSLHEVLGILFL